MLPLMEVPRGNTGTLLQALWPSGLTLFCHAFLLVALSFWLVTVNAPQTVSWRNTCSIFFLGLNHVESPFSWFHAQFWEQHTHLRLLQVFFCKICIWYWSWTNLCLKSGRFSSENQWKPDRVSCSHQWFLPRWLRNPECGHWERDCGSISSFLSGTPKAFVC